MGTRVRLNSLLSDAKTALEPESPAGPPAAPGRTEAATSPSQEAISTPTQSASAAPSKTTGQGPSRSASRRPPVPSAPERVHYSSLVRKEARLRDDQVESLTLRARKLSRNKTTGDQRITDNTLIRVAVDLLLAREADLSGTSEAELRRSLGL